MAYLTARLDWDSRAWGLCRKDLYVYLIDSTMGERLCALADCLAKQERQLAGWMWLGSSRTVSREIGPCSCFSREH